MLFSLMRVLAFFFFFFFFFFIFFSPVCLVFVWIAIRYLPPLSHAHLSAIWSPRDVTQNSLLGADQAELLEEYLDDDDEAKKVVLPTGMVESV